MNGLASAIDCHFIGALCRICSGKFLSGITGQLYRQFTITIAVSVLLSTVVALTLESRHVFAYPEARQWKEKEYRIPQYQ